MLITIPVGLTVALVVLRLVIGAGLAVLAMRRGMSFSLKVGWTFALQADYAPEQAGRDSSVAANYSRPVDAIGNSQSRDRDGVPSATS
jgi:hypothetical protein